MTVEDDLKPFRRILVALDSSAESLAVLEAAAWLAGTLRSTLTGLFVEEQDLLHLADLPFSKEVPLTPATARNLDPARLRREMRARAALARRALEQEARRWQVQWAFEVVRGHAETEIADSTKTGDLVAMTREMGALRRAGRLGSAARSTAAQSRGAVLVASPSASLRPGPVTVAFDGAGNSMKALQLAVSLAKSKGTRIEVLYWAPDGQTAAALETKARGAIGTGSNVIFRPIGGGEPGALLQQLRHVDRGLIVLAMGRLLANSNQLDSLMKSACCPILLLSE